MKKLIAALLCISMLCTAAAAYYPDIADPELNMMAETLNIVGVIDGVGDGTFNPGGYLTREQFAKIAVCILGDREKAASSLAATAFIDVSADSWARGYISYVAEKGIIAGFPDGSFGGSQVLTYAQAAMILLRCLGYSDQEIGFHWPSDCVNKAEAIGLNAGLSLTANDSVTRGDAARLVYNALFTDINGQTGTMLISKTGITVHEDAVLYGVNKNDSSVTETSAGSFRTARGAVGLTDAAGRKGDLFVNKDNEIILFQSSGEVSRDIVVTACLRNDSRAVLEVSYNGGSVSIPYTGILYYDGEKLTAAAAADSITVGSTLSLYFDGQGRYSAGVLNSYVMEGPFTVTRDYTQVYSLFDLNGEPNVIRRGVTADLSSVSRFDVVYYARSNNTLYAYNDKVSGIYEKAAPFKAGVTSVTLSGKEYRLSTTEAMNKLNESEGAFAIGDYITLLLDRDGMVADAVDTSASNISDLGVLINAYTRISDSGSQEYVAKIFLADGSTMEYVADSDYIKLKGALVRMSFRGGRVSMTRVSPVSQSGKLDKENRSFGGRWLTTDCSILVLAADPENGDSVVQKIRLSDIEGSELQKYQVIHVETVGVMQDIALMYLKDVNRTDYDYGLIVRTDYASKGESGSRVTTGVYDLLLHGRETTISVGRRAFVTGVVGINSLNSDDIVDAVELGSGRRVGAVSLDRVKVDDTVYKAAADLDIYKRTGPGEYALISAEEATALSAGKVTVYGDHRLADGGIARVIVIE